MTRLIHDAREIAIDRLKSEADQLGDEEVIGVKTCVAEIGNGLVEFMAIGTAVRKTPGVKWRRAALPPHAIGRPGYRVDGDFGFQLDQSR